MLFVRVPDWMKEFHFTFMYKVQYRYNIVVYGIHSPSCVILHPFLTAKVI